MSPESQNFSFLKKKSYNRLLLYKTQLLKYKWRYTVTILISQYSSLTVCQNTLFGKQDTPAMLLWS